MEFEKRKAAAMAALSAAGPDKSPKGGVDAAIVPLLAAINRHPSLFTTSSCSGRISILSHPIPSNPNPNPDGSKEKTTTKKKKTKAGGGGWVFVSHDPADPDAVVDVLFTNPSVEGGDLVLRFEPLIIAVDCRDVAAAQSLVAAAISAGFRESGITSLQKRIMVAIRCSIRLEVPLGQLGSLVVSPEYVRYLVQIANDKMEANKKRTDGFLALLQSKGLPESTSEMPDTNTAYETQSVKGGSASTLYSGEDRDDGLSCKNALQESNCLDDGEVACKDIDRSHVSESSDIHNCSLEVALLKIVGEPVEKLFLWGQSACVLNNREKQVIIFGGFGGLGRHARRNYTLVLDAQSGLLREMDAKGLPTPRLGHSATIIGTNVYVVGGRTGPSQVLSDVWVLQTTESRWLQLECNGDSFNPRHRHAAVPVGSNIYVFGGLGNEVIYSSMTVLNTETLHWSEIPVVGEWPCARHSHSMVANGLQLFMFGGHDGEKALGDFYSFDISTQQWKMERFSGKLPSPRFSHSMFVYKDCIGIVGGCPFVQHCRELALLNLSSRVWRKVDMESISENIWVRSSVVVVDDDLIIVGGGASCYAFGTKFNQPTKISLHLLESLCDPNSNKENKSVGIFSEDPNLRHITDISTNGHSNVTDAEHLVLQLEKNNAKLVKDVLKKFGWLDLTRKVLPSQDGCLIRFPVNRTFHGLFLDEQRKPVNDFDNLDELHQLGLVLGKEFEVDDDSRCRALKVLLLCGGGILNDDVPHSRKVSKSPQRIMKESVHDLLRRKGMAIQLLAQLPTRWDHLGDIVVLPKTSFRDPLWASIGDELWPLVAKSLGAQRLARQGGILPTGTRDSTLELLVGDNGWVTLHENGILYSFDATKCMFSSGNRSEKLRMARLYCENETVVDLFAGIGYFVLPFLVKANAKFVYACEWNPHALAALKHNVDANSLADRCVILEGDNRLTAPKGVADRVCLGLLPSSECSWATAVRALRAVGGVLHIHGNVNDSKENLWLDYVVQSIRSISESEGLSWNVSIEHVERVKWYGPHIRHLVADVRCKQL